MPTKKVHQQGRQTLPRTFGMQGVSMERKERREQEGEMPDQSGHIIWVELSHCLSISEERRVMTLMDLQTE